MPKKKRAGAELRWNASANADCREGRFIQVGNSLLLCDAFKALSPGARALYFAMLMEAGGRDEFQLPKSDLKKYGFPERSARRYIEELREAGFITWSSGWTVREPNDYKFSPTWRTPKGPP